MVFILHSGGQTVFWIFGLALCLFVGPAQSASRSFLARLIPAGREGEVFGLDADDGARSDVHRHHGVRDLRDDCRLTGVGHPGNILILAIGLALLIPVKPNQERIEARQ